MLIGVACERIDWSARIEGGKTLVEAGIFSLAKPLRPGNTPQAPAFSSKLRRLIAGKWITWIPKLLFEMTKQDKPDLFGCF
jgi:hypothetical protein